MKLRIILGFLLPAAVCLVLCPVSLFGNDAAKPVAKVIALNSPDHQEILRGPPESVRMKSGYVVLAPKQSVGEHSTGHYEELLVVLEGEGEMIFGDGRKLAVKANSALYCPPETRHNVTNTGHTALRYVYVVADTQ